MDGETIAREAAWMVPTLIAVGVVLLGALVGLVVWIFTTFRADISRRLDAQDRALGLLTKAVNDIKDLLTAEVGKILDRVWHHHTRLTEHHARLTALERHIGGPVRDEAPGGD